MTKLSRRTFITLPIPAALVALAGCGRSIQNWATLLEAIIKAADDATTSLANGGGLDPNTAAQIEAGLSAAMVAVQTVLAAAQNGTVTPLQLAQAAAALGQAIAEIPGVIPAGPVQAYVAAFLVAVNVFLVAYSATPVPQLAQARPNLKLSTKAVSPTLVYELQARVVLVQAKLVLLKVSR